MTLKRNSARRRAPSTFTSARYPEIRGAYAGHELVQALDRVDAQARAGVTQLAVIRWLDLLERVLVASVQGAIDPGSLINRTLDGVYEALEAHGFLAPLDA